MYSVDDVKSELRCYAQAAGTWRKCGCFVTIITWPLVLFTFHSLFPGSAEYSQGVTDAASGSHQ